MKHILFLSMAMLIFTMQLRAQDAIPAGVLLPVRLNSSLDSGRVKPGRVITARVMEEVRLSSGFIIPVGAEVIGHVVEVKRLQVKQMQGSAEEVSVRFDRVVTSNRTISITTHLRALASMMAVDQAQVPTTGPDRGTAENEWETEQIGSDDFYFRNNPAARSLFTDVVVPPVSRCKTESEGGELPHLLWVFSPRACGAYGFSHLAIAHAGRTYPQGEITLASDDGNVNVRAGSGMLLRVDGERRE